MLNTTKRPVRLRERAMSTAYEITNEELKTEDYGDVFSPVLEISTSWNAGYKRFETRILRLQASPRIVRMAIDFDRTCPIATGYAHPQAARYSAKKLDEFHNEIVSEIDKLAAEEPDTWQATLEWAAKAKL